LSEDREAPQPEDVSTPAELAQALNKLRQGRSYSQLAKAAKELRKEFPDSVTELPDSTVSDLVNGKKGTSEKTLSTYLRVCGVSRDERGRWISAWMRTRGIFANIVATVDSDGIEVAPAYGAAIDAWISRREQECLTEPAPGGSVKDLMREVESGFSLIADVTRRIGQLPEKPQGKADPMAFGRFGAEAVGQFVQRLTEAAQTMGKRPAAPAPFDYDAEVVKYLQECREVLQIRARAMVARWPGSALRLRLINPSEVDVTGVVVHLFFPEGVLPIEPDAAMKTAPGLPPQPARGGLTSSPTFTLRRVWEEDYDLIGRLTEVFPEEKRTFKYSLVAQEGTTVAVVAGIDLSSNGSVALPAIPLLVDASAGDEFIVRWRATGSAINERFSGKVSVSTRPSTLSLDALLPS
jgi:hypothetical protein